jgi:hypothetical protein
MKYLLAALLALTLASTSDAQVILGAGHPSSPQYGYYPYVMPYRPYYGYRSYGCMPYGGGAYGSSWLLHFHSNWAIEEAAAMRSLRGVR